MKSSDPLLRAISDIHRAAKSFPLRSMEHRALTTIAFLIYAIKKQHWSDAAFDVRFLERELPTSKEDAQRKRAILAAHFAEVDVELSKVSA